MLQKNISVHIKIINREKYVNCHPTCKKKTKKRLEEMGNNDYFCRIMTRILLIVVVWGLGMMAKAQRNEIFSERIKTLQVQPNGEWNQSPIIKLKSGDRLNISFDDLTHEYHRYRYRVEMCNFDWTVNDQLFDSDYLTGETGDLPIDKYEKSLNTSVLYTHYSFSFPNSRMGVALSGNYRITVFDDDEDEEVIHIHFCVLDNKAMVNATADSDTDIDHDKNHQQIRFTVSPTGLRVINPMNEIKTVVLQNNRWDNAALNPKADNITPSLIEWKYAPELIFNAANEYRKFELTSLHIGSMGIDKIRWFDPYYHVQLWEAKDRKNYLYDEDQDGAFYVRTRDYDDSDIQADYVLMHFSLKRDPLMDGDLYVSGAFTRNMFLPENQMEYNIDTQTYEATILLKQGYYNYQYLFLPKGKETAVTEPVEGDYFQTENKYTILVYHRPAGGRYDQLVGMREFKFLQGR